MKSELKNNLSEIVSICMDGALGYESASANLADTDLQTMFNRLSQQRKLFVEELKHQSRDYGITLDESTSVAGFFHRTWLNTRAVFSFDRIELVIDASITGEQKAVEVYTNVLKDDNLPKNLKEKLNEQLQLIVGAINQLKKIELKTSK